MDKQTAQSPETVESLLVRLVIEENVNKGSESSNEVVGGDDCSGLTRWAEEAVIVDVDEGERRRKQRRLRWRRRRQIHTETITVMESIETIIIILGFTFSVEEEEGCEGTVALFSAAVTATPVTPNNAGGEAIDDAANKKEKLATKEGRLLK